MKIEAINASAYLRHLSVLAYLAGRTDPQPHDLYEKLCRIEDKAHRQAERECNTNVPEELSAKFDERTRHQVIELLPLMEGNLIINGDPRGYTLKGSDKFAKLIEERTGIRPYTDWGGYFILAPEF